MARTHNRELEAYWRGLLTADGGDTAAKRFRAAIKTARQVGLTYQPVDEVARLETAELVERVTALEQKATLVPGNPVVTAVLGGAETSCLRLSDLFEVLCAAAFWTGDELAILNEEARAIVLLMAHTGMQRLRHQHRGHDFRPLIECVNGTSRTASETRPKNVALLYCQKD